MGIVKINADFCKACEFCISACPNNVLSLSDELNALGYCTVLPDYEKTCIACKLCAIVCPEGAISVYRLTKGG